MLEVLVDGARVDVVVAVGEAVARRGVEEVPTFEAVEAAEDRVQAGVDGHDPRGGVGLTRQDADFTLLQINGGRGKLLDLLDPQFSAKASTAKTRRRSAGCIAEDKIDLIQRRSRVAAASWTP